MKFDQFEPGQTITAGPYEVTESEIIEFARQYDPQWFHTDPAKASDSRFGGLIASGWHTCGIAMRLAVEAALDSSESFASPGLEYIKWLQASLIRLLKPARKMGQFLGNTGAR